MSTNKRLSKEQRLKAIEGLEQNPNDKLGILADGGITAMGAAGVGAIAAVAGTTTTSIPLITGLTGIAMVAAAPVGLVAGAAAAGGAAAYGVSRLIKGNGYNKGKSVEIKSQLQHQLKEVEAKEQASKLDDSDKTKFIIALKEQIRLNLITPKDAKELIEAVQKGQLSIKDAIKLVEDLLK